MRSFLFLLMTLSLLHVSCSKEAVLATQEHLLVNKVKHYLSDSLSQKDFQGLNFSKTNICNYGNGLQTVVVPFNNDDITSRQFVGLKIMDGELFETAKIVAINFSTNYNNSLLSNERLINGSIAITSLNRKHVFNSPIINGYIIKLHEAETSNDHTGYSTTIVPYVTIPEVIVIGYLPSTSGYSGSWYNMLSILGLSGNSNNYYQTLGSFTGGGGAGTLSGGGGSYVPTTPLQVDYDTDYYKAGIDVVKYLNCFNAIPDAGALTSVTLLTDIPVDNDENVFFDWANGSPGHTFIRLNKSNGSQHVQQVIGFYPVNGWKTALIPDPIDGKFVDNGQHEFNASIRMTLTPAEFRTALDRIILLTTLARYDIDEFNCTDFALDIFNHNRTGNPLIIPQVNLPGGGAGILSNTPQGLYQRLRTMKGEGGPESGNINLPTGKAYDGWSEGPCN